MISTDQLRLMLDKARLYLSSVKVLCSHGDYYSAVSRIYYAMFYCAQALVLTRSPAVSSHKAVLSLLAKHFIKTGLLPRRLHGWLRHAFERRQISDYQFKSPATDAEVSELSDRAAEFLDSTEALLRSEELL